MISEKKNLSYWNGLSPKARPAPARPRRPSRLARRGPSSHRPEAEVTAVAWPRRHPGQACPAPTPHKKGSRPPRPSALPAPCSRQRHCRKPVAPPSRRRRGRKVLPDCSSIRRIGASLGRTDPTTSIHVPSRAYSTVSRRRVTARAPSPPGDRAAGRSSLPPSKTSAVDLRRW
jgi:hypothetical protein